METRIALKKEIEYAHKNRNKNGLIRDYDLMFDIVLSATSTYTNLSLFWNDYVNNKEMLHSEKTSAFNDLYLLALLHIDNNCFLEMLNGEELEYE